METLLAGLAALLSYLTLWTYFDASRQRDAYHVGRGPRDLPPNAWAALVFFFAPVAFPLYLKARSNVPLVAGPRSGAPPVFESRGLNVYGWLAGLLFLGAAAWLMWEREFLLTALAVALGMVAVFGGRRIVATDKALRIDLPPGAAWEQVGFRPLPRGADDREDEDDEQDLVVNLDRLPSPAARPAAPPWPAAAPEAAPAWPPAPSAPAWPPPALAAPAPAPVWPPAPAPAWPSAGPSAAGPSAASRPSPASPIPPVPSVSSFPAAAPPAPAAMESQAAPAGPPAQARPPAQTSVRISDIIWAASEDGFDDGSSGPSPGARGASPHATVAADPALFRNLGGIFAPPGSAAPGSFPPPAGPPPSPAGPPPLRPPAGPPFVPPAAAAPAFAAPAPAPPAPRPWSAGGPGPAPSVSSAPASPPPRVAPPIGGAYAASSEAADSRLPQALLAALAGLLLLGGGWWYFSGRGAEPAPPPPEEAAPPADPAPPRELPAADPGAPGGESGGAAGEPTEGARTEGAPLAGDESYELTVAREWMQVYLDRFGPVGQSVEEIDFEGFAPGRCSALRASLDSIGELPRMPDDQLNFQISACRVAMGSLADDCERQDTAAWCAHLIETRSCLHQVQTSIELRWGLPGLIEFQISETEPRSTASMSGRCLAEEARRNAGGSGP